MLGEGDEEERRGVVSHGFRRGRWGTTNIPAHGGEWEARAGDGEGIARGEGGCMGGGLPCEDVWVGGCAKNAEGVAEQVFGPKPGAASHGGGLLPPPAAVAVVAVSLRWWRRWWVLMCD